MIFSVQRFLEDYFEKRQLEDNDQYAVKVANAFARDGESAGKSVSRIRTVFFRSNPQLNRSAFEAQLLELLEGKFSKKKSQANQLGDFPGGVVAEARRIAQAARRDIGSVLAEFRHAIQARGVETFWVSRKKGRLIGRPENVGQSLLAMFLQGVVRSRGFMTREVGSGVGFIDILVCFASTPHLIELKVLTTRFQGPSQLNQYMLHEKRKIGWLVVFDARSQNARARAPAIPLLVSTSGGRINVLVIDINPTPPSRIE